MTSDLLLKRPEATKRSISCSKCGVITLLMRKLLSNRSHLLSIAPGSTCKNQSALIELWHDTPAFTKSAVRTVGIDPL
jgi:hypothetical protein